MSMSNVPSSNSCSLFDRARLFPSGRSSMGQIHFYTTRRSMGSIFCDCSDRTSGTPDHARRHGRRGRRALRCDSTRIVRARQRASWRIRKIRMVARHRRVHYRGLHSSASLAAQHAGRSQGTSAAAHCSATAQEFRGRQTIPLRQSALACPR
jgi:hypothetical protein